MINFIKNIFKKKLYTILGQGGISYSSGGDVFYIETNNFLEKKEYSVEIFYKDIKSIKNKIALSESDKKQLAIIVKDLLNDDGIKAIIS